MGTLNPTNPNELQPGDDPIPVRGTYSLHLYSPGATATAQSTHFVDDPASWVAITQLEDVNNAGVVLELGGSIRVIDGDANTRLSVIAVSMGGLR